MRDEIQNRRRRFAQTAVSDRHLVYLAYGPRRFLDEAIYSLASFVAVSGPGAAAVTVYTDNAGYLRSRLPAEVRYEELRPDRIRSWRGPTDFVHRVKVEMLRDFCARQHGTLVYVDTDTVFLKPLDGVFAALERDGAAFMHENEGRLSSRRNPIFRKLLAVFRRESFTYRGAPLRVPAECAMWNAGLIGLRLDQRRLLDEVLDLTDQFHARYPKHVMEQFAFSFVLSREPALRAAADCVHHYWNFKEFGGVLSAFLAKHQTFEEVVANRARIDPAELIRPKLEFERLSPPARFFRKHLLRRTWALPDIDY